MKEKVSPTQRALNVWAIILIIWCVYRSQFKTELPEWFDEFIAKPLVFLVPLYYYIKHYEKKNFFEAVDLKWKNHSTDILMSLGMGLVFFMTGAAAHFVKTGSFMPPVDKVATVLTLGYYVALAFASSISEEILSRGFVLKRLYDESKNVYTSVFFSSFLFFFLHVPMLFTNQQIFGQALLQIMFTDLVLSLAVSIMYIQRRNVLLPIFIHAFYNLSIYLFLQQ
jgi:membrane protease YdiL (CAAX protease family)